MSYAKLRGKIREVFGRQENFAEAMGIDPSTLSAKLNNKSPWTREDIELVCELLHIDLLEIPEYFFMKKVEKSQ
jgi:transcriptional regulator with XRE-family HTH domain